MLAVPAGVERDLSQGEVCVGYLLASVFMSVAIFVDHRGPRVLSLNTHQDKPVRSADLTEVAGDGIHHPIALRVVCEVLATICQQVSAAYAVVALGACELRQLGSVKQGHGLRLKVAFKHAVCCRRGAWAT